MKFSVPAAIKWGGCLLLAQWMAIPQESRSALLVLIGLMVIDYFTGLSAAFITKSLASEVGARGILKKGMSLILLLAVHMLERSAGVEFHLETAGAFGFIVNEGISIVENCNRAGVWVPEALVKALAAAKGK